MKKYFHFFSPYETEKATSDQNTSEDWQQILEINDRVAVEQNGPKDCMRSIINRLYSDVPWVILQTLTVSKLVNDVTIFFSTTTFFIIISFSIHW